MSAPDKTAKYVAASIDDIPTIPYEWAPETEWKPIRRYFSIGSFGTNLFRAPKAGDVLTEDHAEDPDSGTRHEELYLVVTGTARFKVDGEEFDAPAGTFVYVPDPRSERGAVAGEPGTVLFAVAASLGAPTRPRSGTRNPCPAGPPAEPAHDRPKERELDEQHHAEHARGPSAASRSDVLPGAAGTASSAVEPSAGASWRSRAASTA